MNISLGIRVLALLAFVATLTAVILKPDLLGAAAQQDRAFATSAAFGRA